MNKDEILEYLQAITGNPATNLPRDMDFDIIDGVLMIGMHDFALTENMQNNSSAFEAYAVLLKRWIPEIHEVRIRWVEPLLHFTSYAKGQHYQRFLFRAFSFSDAYLWFNVDGSNHSSISQLVTGRPGNYFLNSPSGPRSRNFNEVWPLQEYSESKLEEFIMSHIPTATRFRNIFQLHILDNQLPVGVFSEYVSKTTKVFTGAKSAIDIWGINGQNEFCLFELKKDDNKMVGALTEMFFYSALIQNVIDGELLLLEGMPEADEISQCDGVNCFLLAPNTHHLIDNEVFQVLNQNELGISYRNVRIEMNEHEMDFIILPNEN